MPLPSPNPLCQSICKTMICCEPLWFSVGIFASCSQLGLFSANDLDKDLPLPSLSVPEHVAKGSHLPPSSGQTVWAAEGKGHGHLSKDGSQSLQTSTGYHLPSWVKLMVHGDQDACTSQWLFLQTVI